MKRTILLSALLIAATGCGVFEEPASKEDIEVIQKELAEIRADLGEVRTNFANGFNVITRNQVSLAQITTNRTITIQPTTTNAPTHTGTD